MLELADIADVVAGAVRDATAPLLARIEQLEAREIPAPAQGEAGPQGERGEKGEAGERGEAGAAGADGVGLADALIDNDGHLVLTMSDGRTKSLCRVVGQDGAPGKDGATFTLDDFAVEAIDERTIRLAFTQGGECHSFELEFPVLIGRGVWREGEAYARGDVTLWGGSAWEAVEPKGLKPDAPDSGWRLFVKRGRDGKSVK